MQIFIWIIMFFGCLRNNGFGSECNFNVLSRNSCPQNGNEYDKKSVCEEDNCCWDTTYNGVPFCFLPENESTNDNESNITNSSFSTIVICINCNQGARSQIVDERVKDVTDAVDNMLLTHDKVEDVDQLIDNAFSNLTKDESVEVMEEILNSVQETYNFRASNNSYQQNIELWVYFFDRLITQPSVKTRNNSKIFLNVSSEILLKEATVSNHILINQTMGFDVINTLESYAFTLTQSIIGDVSQSTDATNVVLEFRNVTFTACYEDGSGFGCGIKDDRVVASVTSSLNRSYVTAVSYDPILSAHLFSNSRLLNQDVNVGSSVFSVTSHDGENSATAVNINITFSNLENVGNDNDTIVCSFFSSSNIEWSGSGCYLTQRNASSASCSCDHNTSFALLFLHADIQFTSEEESSFEIITFIGSGTSITALLLTIFSFFYLKLTRIKRVILHLNLSSTLCVAQIILLIGTRITTGSPLCKAIAVLLHFFFMSSFSWMLMEGVLLYFQSVRATKGDVNFKLMIVFGWLLPTVIVGVSFASGYNGYGVDKGCWLSIQNGLTWAFIGPSLGFILINAILLGFIVRVFLQLKSNAKTGEWHRTKRSIRAILLLTPLLGITWVFGALAVDESTKWFLYLFSVCNSFQGLAIFFFHCLHNHDVRKAFLKKYRRSFQNVPPFFSSVNPTTTTSKTVKTTSGYISTPSTTRKNWD